MHRRLIDVKTAFCVYWDVKNAFSHESKNYFLAHRQLKYFNLKSSYNLISLCDRVFKKCSNRGYDYSKPPARENCEIRSAVLLKVVDVTLATQRNSENELR